jgi:membrane AbrB-like protein
MARRFAQWGALLILSAIAVACLEAVRLPAALLLGSMGAAIAVAAGGVTLRMPRGAFMAAQGVLGCLIASSIPLSTLGEILRHWPLFVVGVVSVVAAANGLGWLLTRWQVLPGTSAIWGSSPGAATAMTLMSESYGADIRLVALMQYLRVVCVTATASLVTRLSGIGTAPPPPAPTWFPAIAWMPFAETLAVAGAAVLVAVRLGIPGGPLLVPLAAALVLQDTGLLQIELPPWLLGASYAVVGWSIGLRFTRPILVYAARALPRILASIVALIAVCGVMAGLLVILAGIDPLTAYLATSPGGADSIAIIAASSAVDLPFVMAMQTARLLVVLVTGPSLARFIAKKVAGAEGRGRER